MTKLSVSQQALVESIVQRLAAIDGVRAVVLGGSYARGVARPDSDIDLGLFYSACEPFAIDAIRAIAASMNDTPGPVVTGFYEWGRWVNGGAWLAIGGQRVDLLYRSLEHVERTIADAEAGRYEVDYEQQPPFGFFSGTYLGEIAICLPLFDPDGLVAALKRRVATYPEPLREAVVTNNLWSAEFALAAFAPKYAARGDSYGTASCLTRAVNNLVHALFALNRAFPVNDKTVLAEIDAFDLAPRELRARVQSLLAQPGSTPDELAGTVEGVARILGESIALAGDAYRSRYSL